MGKASTGKLLRGGDGCFYEGQDLLREGLPKGEVSLGEGSLHGREFFRGRSLQKTRARVSLANAGGSRRVLCQAAPTRQQESMQHNQLPGGLQRSLGAVRESLARLQLSCQGWACLSPLEALAGIPPQPTSTLVIPLPPLPFNRTADKLNAAGITAICSGYRCRY